MGIFEFRVILFDNPHHHMNRFQSHAVPCWRPLERALAVLVVRRQTEVFLLKLV